MPLGSRQQPGLACEECRKRKLRCDRAKPRCHVCEEVGVECVVNAQRSRRGPKKGHLKALRNRIASLENLIDSDRDGSGHLQQNTEPPAHSRRQSSSDGGSGGGLDSPQKMQDFNVMGMRKHRERNGSLLQSAAAAAAASLTTPPPDLEMSEMMEADLDQLYFDRVHDVAPIIHHGRYLSWSRQPHPTTSQTCLQASMWTLAASASAHLHHMRETLYARARSKLDALDSNIGYEFGATPALEQVQAWLLLAHYEFRYMNYQRAWITAGRAFRIIQLARLHEIDRLGDAAVNMAIPELWVEAEEKRRTFWLAYCLDRFVNLCHDWPLSLSEESIWTCLPASESDFQHSRPAQADYLPVAIDSSGQTMLPPFAETIVATTLCWRGLSLKRLCASDDVGSLQTYSYYLYLCQTMQKRVALLSLPPSSSELIAPLRLFANLLANATIVWLYNNVGADNHAGSNHAFLVALASAREVAGLGEPLTRCSPFKTHAFSPMLLYTAAKFLRTHCDAPCTPPLPDQERRDMMDSLIQALTVLRHGNHLAMKYLEVLDPAFLTGLRGLSPQQDCFLTEDTHVVGMPFWDVLEPR